MNLTKPNALKYCAAVAAIMMFLALYPQINLWLAQGRISTAVYVQSNYDEPAYASYINALAHGQTRRADPFAGNANAPYESLFSVQFVPAYVLAAPTRLFGTSTATVFVWLMPLMALSAIFALFWLLRQQTGDAAFSAVGALLILCAGTFAAGQGVGRGLLGSEEICHFFPFLRRYQPGLMFPLFFVFVGLIWRGLRAETVKRSLVYGVASGAILATLIFSYFYLWTAAIAWLACVAMLWAVARKDERGRVVAVSVPILLSAMAGLVPYFKLLAQRSLHTDSVQVLQLTHAPQLFALPEVIGYIVLVALILAARQGRIDWRAPRVLWAASLALLPVAVFNQQIISGRSLQPIHYQLFIVNYAVLLAVVLTIHLLWQARAAQNQTENCATALPQFPRRVLLYVAVAATCLGLAEAGSATKLGAGFARASAEAVPVVKRLQQLAAADHTSSASAPVVFTPNFGLAEFFPAYAPVRALWGVHTTAAGGFNQQENKELLFRHLYFSGVTPEEMRTAIAGDGFEIRVALFGAERALHALGTQARPLTVAEVQREVQTYQAFTQNMSATHAHQPRLSYAVVPTEAQPNWKNIDRWYIRDAGEKLGLFTLYRLQPRP